MPSARTGAPTPAKRQDGVLQVPAQKLLTLLDAPDLEALIDAAFPIAHGVVECQFVSAFYRNSPNGLLKERDSRGIAYTAQFTRRYIELTPAIPLAIANPGIRMITTPQAIPDPDPVVRASAFYREIMQCQGWRHSVALCFWGEPTDTLPVFVLSVYRREGESDFTRPDLAQLDNLHPFIECAVNRLQERERARSMRDSVSLTGRDGNRGLAVLDSSLRLVEANAMAWRLVRIWGGAGATSPDRHHPVWLLPPELAQECDAMRGEWNAALFANPDATARCRRRLQHRRVKTLHAEITMVCRNATGLSAPMFVVELERRAPRKASGARSETTMLGPLTAAERAVALIVAEGLSNQEVADRLGKSVDAVKFLLHRVYQKTGTASRTALAAALRA